MDTLSSSNREGENIKEIEIKRKENRKEGFRTFQE
jgi:hypothetical protein